MFFPKWNKSDSGWNCKILTVKSFILNKLQNFLPKFFFSIPYINMSWWGFFYIEDTVPMLQLFLHVALSVRKNRQSLLQGHMFQIFQQVKTV